VILKDGAPISLDGAGVIDAARATLSTAFFDLAIKVNKGLGKHFKPPPALRRFLKKIF